MLDYRSFFKKTIIHFQHPTVSTAKSVRVALPLKACHQWHLFPMVVVPLRIPRQYNQNSKHRPFVVRVIVFCFWKFFFQNWSPIGSSLSYYGFYSWIFMRYQLVQGGPLPVINGVLSFIITPIDGLKNG